MEWKVFLLEMLKNQNCVIEFCISCDARASVMMGASGFDEELEHITDGPLHQQHLFRLMYKVHRAHCLYEGAPIDARRIAIIVSCSEVLKDAFPDFDPEYDKKYFTVVQE